MKYNKKVLWDFLNNKQIPQNITDYNFYIEAINITNDKELYYKCPKDIQNNYTFVLYLIDKFKDDTKFINIVAQNYLENTPKNNYTYQELIFIMSDLITDKENVYYYHYQAPKDCIYNSKKNIIEEFLDEEKYSEEFGLGFLVVLENEQSKIIADYFATKFIEKIFYEIVRYDLEEIIHMTYKDRFDFVTYGIDNFIIEFISVFDGYLAHYLKDNMYLTKDIRKYIKSLAQNWNKYVKINYGSKINELEIALQTIISKYSSKLTLEEIYNYIDKKSQLLPIKLSNDYEEENILLSEKKINIEDYKCLKEALNIAENIFRIGEEKKQKEKRDKTKILKFNNNKE